MTFSTFKGPFETRIVAWDTTLRTVSEVIDEWVAAQRTWMYLAPIFDSPDIAKQLPVEAKRFATVDKHWRTTVAAAAVPGTLVLTFCNDSRLLERFRESNKVLDVIQKGLTDYLQSKREGFARFFFLADADLLEILSETRDPTYVQPHVRKCFPEDDHEILTDQGFKSLDEIQETLSGHSTNDPLLYASYLPHRKQLVYSTGALVVNEAREQTMVEFTHVCEAFCWCDASITSRCSGTDAGLMLLSRHGSSNMKGHGTFPSDQRTLSVEVVTARRSHRNSSFDRVSVVATGNHDMYVAVGKTRDEEGAADPKSSYWPFAERDKIPAKDILQLDSDCVIQMLTCAEEGLLVSDDPTTTAFIQHLFSAMGLHSDDEIVAFLELYGFWLSNSILYRRPTFAVSFVQRKDSDFNFIKQRLNTCSISYVRQRRLCKGVEKLEWVVHAPKWVAFFFGEYDQTCQPCSLESHHKTTTHQPKYILAVPRNGLDNPHRCDIEGAAAVSRSKTVLSLLQQDSVVLRLTIARIFATEAVTEETRAPKWLAWWVFQLEKRKSDAVLSGYREANGSAHSKNSDIYTASALLRDQLTRLALHAGHSTCFELEILPKSFGPSLLAARDMSAASMRELWKIKCSTRGEDGLPSSQSLAVTPILHRDTEIFETSYAGRTWCVETQPGFVVVRRVRKDKNARVVCTSVPTIQGNCFEGMKLLEFTDELIVAAMSSPEAERVVLTTPVDPKGKNIENWLVEIEQAMKASIREHLVRAIAAYPTTPRTQWMLNWPGQVVLNGSQVHWTSEVECAMRAAGNKGVTEYYELSVRQLNDMVTLVQRGLEKSQRITVGALAVIDVHARDVLKHMVDGGVQSAHEFDWISQLRFYWEGDLIEESGNLWVQQVSSRRAYGTSPTIFV